MEVQTQHQLWNGSASPFLSPGPTPLLSQSIHTVSILPHPRQSQPIPTEINAMEWKAGPAPGNADADADADADGWPGGGTEPILR